jgi:hypothetical protein
MGLSSDLEGLPQEFIARETGGLNDHVRTQASRRGLACPLLTRPPNPLGSWSFTSVQRACLEDTILGLCQLLEIRLMCRKIVPKIVLAVEKTARAVRLAGGLEKLLLSGLPAPKTRFTSGSARRRGWLRPCAPHRPSS